MLTLTQDGWERRAAWDERDDPPKSHLFFIYRPENMPQMIQTLCQAGGGRARGRGERPESVRIAAGLHPAFKSRRSRWFVYVRSVRSKTCSLLPTVSRPSVWKTLLIPEVIFTGQFTRGGEVSTGGRGRLAGMSPRICSVSLRLCKRSVEMLTCVTMVLKIPFPAFKRTRFIGYFLRFETLAS